MCIIASFYILFSTFCCWVQLKWMETVWSFGVFLGNQLGTSWAGLSLGLLLTTDLSNCYIQCSLIYVFPMHCSQYSECGALLLLILSFDSFPFLKLLKMNTQDLWNLSLDNFLFGLCPMNYFHIHLLRCSTSCAQHTNSSTDLYLCFPSLCCDLLLWLC